MDLPKLCGGEKPMLIQRLQHLRCYRAKPPACSLMPRSPHCLAHRCDFPVEKMSAPLDRRHFRCLCGAPGSGAMVRADFSCAGSPAKRTGDREPGWRVIGDGDEPPVADQGRTRNDVQGGEASGHDSRDDTPAGIAPRGGEVYNRANDQLPALTVALPGNAGAHQSPQRTAALRPRQERPRVDEHFCLAWAKQERYGRGGVPRPRSGTLVAGAACVLGARDKRGAGAHAIRSRDRSAAQHARLTR